MYQAFIVSDIKDLRLTPKFNDKSEIRTDNVITNTLFDQRRSQSNVFAERAPTVTQCLFVNGEIDVHCGVEVDVITLFICISVFVIRISL